MLEQSVSEWRLMCTGQGPTVVLDEYTCECADGYDGFDCENTIDLCDEVRMTARHPSTT